jgi:hypothetical protein
MKGSAMKVDNSQVLRVLVQILLLCLFIFQMQSAVSKYFDYPVVLQRSDSEMDG